ncbi:MAG: nucleotidyltransferase family protein [Candidatus Omnitrophica bacterium]|nr:nucleotidyltransferase family protein [Candidatus Omnitrophota bacterium]
MSELEKIKQTLKEHKCKLCQEFNIKRLGIFGSYVRGEQKRKSDIDILVSFSATPGLFDYMKIENHLSDVLKKKVDLVMKGALKSTIAKNVMREVEYV